MDSRSCISVHNPVCRRRFAQPPGGGSPFGQDTLKVEKNIPYAATKILREALDVYLPKAPKSDRPLPVVVNIHGGAFRMGDKNIGAARIAGSSPAVTMPGSQSTTGSAGRQSGRPRSTIARPRSAGFGPTPGSTTLTRITSVSSAGRPAGISWPCSAPAATALALEGDLGPYKGTSSKVKCVVDQFGPSDLLAMGGSHDSPESPEAKLHRWRIAGEQGRGAGCLTDYLRYT